MKIRVFIILFAALIFGLQDVSAQTAAQIAKIRAKVSVINKNMAKYKMVKRDVEGISLEGAEAKFYSSGAALKKTTVKIYGETYNAVAEIYYEDSKPIFIYEKRNKYDKPFNLSPKVISVEETRTYYVDKQIVRMLIGKKEIKASNEMFEEKKKEFSDLADKLFAAFNQ